MAEPTNITNQLLARFEAKSRETPPPVAATPSAALPDDERQRQSYLQAAAVLHVFQAETLLPLDPALKHPKPRLLLFDDIVYASGELFEGRFTLLPAVRREALKRLVTRQAMQQALLANPGHTMTPLQQMWEGWLSGGSLPIPESLGYHDLTCYYQIITWLDGSQPGLPDATALLALLRRKSVLAGFEHLVTNHFTGREAELALLSKYVGIRLPESKSPGLISSTINALLSTDPKPVLALYGPGGIGKSALAGRLLWLYAQDSAQQRVPFAYLAFDQPTLRIENPFTLLVEAAAQLELQFPEQVAAFSQFNDRVRDYRDRKGALQDRTSNFSSRDLRLNESQSAELDLFAQFAGLLQEITQQPGIAAIKSPPVLLVLDTFEEVQYRDRESLASFWRMLKYIKERYPQLKVIITGRAPVSETGIDAGFVEERALAELSPTDRVTLLRELGVTDTVVAESVAKQVGGNPLSLRLAANVITSNAGAADNRGIKDLSTRKWLFFQVDERVIQGQLYKRILDHIHDPHVRILAHPGMVLRVTSPDIILRVLAPVCGIAISTIEEATRLFEELKREHALVRTGDNDTLEYRPEIRQAMVKLLQQDKYDEVRNLHRAAIAYYTPQEGLAARGEELFHRLALGEDNFADLDLRWMPGIEQSISHNLEEYPDRVQVWLASRMSFEVPRSVFLNADTADWERNITRKVKRAMTENYLPDALQLLHERGERSSNSPLFALEAKTYLLMGDIKAAEAVLSRGIDVVAGSTNRGRLAELFWLQAQVALLGSDTLRADSLLEQAGVAVAGAGNPLAPAHILCHRMLLRELYPGAYPVTGAVLRGQLNDYCGRITESIAYSASFVIGLIISQLGAEYPQTVERLALFVTPGYPPSPDILTTENLCGLEEYRESWEEAEDNYGANPNSMAALL